ncbi:MAG: helix-turn-helix domain-containing protein [Lachnospiraceae bacterium]|nr:helix-turn-helix domain-containing protein [Lachnospiraceae bacterium]
MKLLIVDDEIYAIQGILDGVDWKKLHFQEILTANSYAQALNHFMKGSIDVLLCDIEMPYGSGLDLVEWIKANHPETVCIFLTCHDEFDFARQAIQLQCLDYVLKPAAPEVLEQVLQKAENVITETQQRQEYEQYGKRYVRELAQPSNDTSGSGRRPDNVIEEVESYIQKHISESFTVEEIARHFYLSADHLTRLFKKQHGQTLIDYITEQRMTLARQLLEENQLTITMISARVGYSNYSYFTKMFKKYYGKTPREYQADFRQS